MNDKSQPERVHLHAYEHLLMICVEIQKGTYPNKAKLARLIEKSPRTVQRYLEALMRMDAPLTYDKKRKGFRFEDRGWQLPPFRLTEGELISFFTAERMLNRLGASEAAKVARNALKRLAQMLPGEVVVDLTTLESAISFAPAPALDASPDVLGKLASAAITRKTLSIDYYSQHRATPTSREIDVLLVHNHLGEWYAVCYDHLRNGVRDFHAGRMSRVEETDHVFKPPAEWNAEKYLSRGFGMFRGGENVTVEVVFDEYQSRYARERKFHATERREELSGGRLKIVFETTENALEQVARWVMQYGKHAVAERPAKLREIISGHLKSSIAMYKEEESRSNA